jgi:hypothetical protein
MQQQLRVLYNAMLQAQKEEKIKSWTVLRGEHGLQVEYRGYL